MAELNDDAKERMMTFALAAKENDFVIDSYLADWLKKNNYFTAPASAKYHGVYEGALFDHSFAVYQKLKDFTEKNELEWQRKESPFIIGMFHDICKCDRYKKVQDPPKPIVDPFKGEYVEYTPPARYEYNENVLLEGHGSKSVILLSQLITLTEEEILCIRYHMGAYEKDDWKGFDNAIKKYPNVMWTHHADMLVSKLEI